MEAREAIQTRFRDGFASGQSTGLWLLAAGIAVAVVSPLLWLVAAAAELPLDQLPALLLRPAAVEALANSLALVAAVTAGSVVLGVPLAVLVVRTDLPFRRFFTVTAALPIVLPSYIGAFAFVSAFGPQGLLTRRLGLVGDLVPPIYGFLGTALVLTLFVYPYVFLGTRAALLTDDPGLIEAARTLNRGRLEAFRAITLPRILPGIAGGASNAHGGMGGVIYPNPSQASRPCRDVTFSNLSGCHALRGISSYRRPLYISRMRLSDSFCLGILSHFPLFLPLYPLASPASIP